jgi:uncharacterized membrane protein
MECLLGRVLRIGVATAGILVLFGLVLFLAHDHGQNRISLDTALGRGTPVRPLGPGEVLDGLRSGQAAAYIELGLLVLILTPIARVALTLVLFERQRDWTFVALSGIVLAILVLGLFGVGA